jgi:lipopolysaccharide/colanic/teichoic acid biosynthesis glycosyltransferase
MKRAMDIAGALAGLVLFSPVILAVCVLIRLCLGKGVFFVQRRPGFKGIPFNLVKFRTMRDRCAADGSPLPDQLRMTRLGSFLRKASLDELPELLNVLKGDMSLVGPRPLLMEYMPLYTPEQHRRHDVRPGLTGWAQIHGRNDTSWEDRLARDVWYVDHRSFWLDLTILVRTVTQVLLCRGVSAEGHVTMPRFQGTPQHRADRHPQ